MAEDTVLNWNLGEPRSLGGQRTLGDKWLDDNRGKTDEKRQLGFIGQYIVDRIKSINLLGGYRSKGFGAVQVELG